MTRILFAAALLVALPASLPALAQGFKDTSMLRAPKGSQVAIYEFEDLECPACSHAFPLVHSAVERYKIPLVRHDFQNFAVGHAIPSVHWLSAKIKMVADAKFEVVLHQPPVDEGWLGQHTPYLLGLVRQRALDNQ